MALHKSGENYLKTIYSLHQRYGEVRECDIAEIMGYSKASVCHMVKVLSEQGYIIVENNDVQLSPLGIETARKVHYKFLVIRCFLTTILGVNEITANQDACEIEHIISDESLSALNRLLAEKGVDFYAASVGKVLNTGL